MAGPSPRDMLEELEAIEQVPLSARCGFWAVRDGVAVEVAVRRDTPDTRGAIQRARVAWPVEEWRWLGIGLGDLLLAAVFPFVARKTFGSTAGIAALAIRGGAIAVVLTLPQMAITYVAFPVMIVLGTLTVASTAIGGDAGRNGQCGNTTTKPAL